MNNWLENRIRLGCCRFRGHRRKLLPSLQTVQGWRAQRGQI